MNILVVGSGGREHAILHALKSSPSVENLHALPGSDGISQIAQCHVQSITPETVLRVAKENQINLVIIGPEQPLCDGVADHLRKNAINVFGPSQAAAKLEGSKIFCKEFLIDAGVPTAFAQNVSSVKEIESSLREFKPPYVLKADGLAGGKGVSICQTADDLKNVAKDFFVKKIHGVAGQTALLEQFTPGVEISYLILTNGSAWTALPVSQDYKRLKDGDVGPNTGGMGTVATVTLPAALVADIEKKVIHPTMAQMTAMSKKSPQFLYRGLLYIGLMITESGPSVIEFNCRFGDPECQVIMPLLDGDWAQVFDEVAKGRVPQLKWRIDRAAACVVMAAEGYPEDPKKGAAITGLGHDDENAYVLHAGTKKSGASFVVNGGRVLNCVGVGKSIQEALGLAYEKVKTVKFSGAQSRTDIGKSANKLG